MNIYPTFGAFLKTNWWFLLLGFGKAFTNSEDGYMTGSVFFDFIVLIGILLILMFVYWFIRYGRRETTDQIMSAKRPKGMPRHEWNKQQMDKLFKDKF